MTVLCDHLRDERDKRVKASEEILAALKGGNVPQNVIEDAKAKLNQFTQMPNIGA